MSKIAESLIAYGLKIANAGLVAGAGGNISAREGDTIWMKPSGFAMDELSVADLCRIRLDDGRQIGGPHKPTSEVNMHLGVYRCRPEIQAVFHTHSPWASGVISSGQTLRPMFAEFVCDLGVVGTVPYVTPTTQALADAVAEKARDCDTLLMENHGIMALGMTLKQAYYRCVVVEDAAKSQLAATLVGKPRFLTEQEVADLMALDAPKHRIQMMSTDA